MATRSRFDHWQVLAWAALGLGLGAVAGRGLDLFGVSNAVHGISPALAITAVLLGGALTLIGPTIGTTRRIAFAGSCGGVFAVLPIQLMIVALLVAGLWSAIRWQEDAFRGWRWWVTLTWITVVSLALGSAVVSLALFAVGTGDPRWNLPRQYHLSVERLDFYTMLAMAWIPGLFAGLVGTRRLLRTVLVMAGTVIATSLVWQLEIRPQHTNDITWQLSGIPLLMVAGTMIGSAVVIARLLRP